MHRAKRDRQTSQQVPSPLESVFAFLADFPLASTLSTGPANQCCHKNHILFCKAALIGPGGSHAAGSSSFTKEKKTTGKGGGAENFNNQRWVWQAKQWPKHSTVCSLYSVDFWLNSRPNLTTRRRLDPANLISYSHLLKHGPKNVYQVPWGSNWIHLSGQITWWNETSPALTCLLALSSSQQQLWHRITSQNTLVPWLQSLHIILEGYCIVLTLHIDAAKSVSRSKTRKQQANLQLATSVYLS